MTLFPASPFNIYLYPEPFNLEAGQKARVSMQVSSSSPRLGTLLSLAGVTLIILGLFLPMFTQSNPQVPGSAHPLYEWQAVTIFDSAPIIAALLRSLALLPLLAMLIVLTTCLAALFCVPLPKLILLKRVAAGWGLGIQLLFDILVFQIFLIGYARTDIAWGLVVVLVGFSVSVVGAFFIKSHYS